MSPWGSGGGGGLKSAKKVSHIIWMAPKVFYLSSIMQGRVSKGVFPVDDPTNFLLNGFWRIWEDRFQTLLKLFVVFRIQKGHVGRHRSSQDRVKDGRSVFRIEDAKSCCWHRLICEVKSTVSLCYQLDIGISLGSFRKLCFFQLAWC